MISPVTFNISLDMNLVLYIEMCQYTISVDIRFCQIRYNDKPKIVGSKNFILTVLFKRIIISKSQLVFLFLHNNFKIIDRF